MYEFIWCQLCNVSDAAVFLTNTDLISRNFHIESSLLIWIFNEMFNVWWNCLMRCFTLRKRWSSPLRIFLVNENKCEVFCEIGYIYDMLMRSLTENFILCAVLIDLQKVPSGHLTSCRRNDLASIKKNMIKWTNFKWLNAVHEVPHKDI